MSSIRRERRASLRRLEEKKREILSQLGDNEDVFDEKLNEILESGTEEQKKNLAKKTKLNIQLVNINYLIKSVSQVKGKTV